MPNKKVALISLYSASARAVPPLASLYLGTALKKHNIEVKIFHELARDYKKVVSQIVDYKPDLVGMSVFTGYHNKIYVDLSRELKQKGYLIIWGNAHPSMLPEQTLSEESINFVAFGEGEETLVELANNLDQPEKYQNILSLGFRDKSGNIVINKRRDFVDMDKYLIDWSLVDLNRFIAPYFSGKYKRMLIITTSRGCPFNCQFCYNLVFNNRRWRAHSAEKLIANLKPVIEKYKIDLIKLDDDNFFVNKERAFNIVRSLGLPYLAEARVEYVDKEFVKNLQSTNCVEITFGFESGSDRILQEVVKKGSTTKDIKKAVELFKDSGVIISGSFVFGFPTETEDEYKKTMRFIIELLEINKNLVFTCGWFLPYAGTGLYEEAKKIGFIPPKKIEDWDQFDRWRNDYKMPWINWDYRLPVKFTRKIIYLLSFSYKKRIPVIKTLLKWRVKYQFFYLPVDIFLLSKLRYYYRIDSKNSIQKMIKRIIKLAI